MAGKLAGGKTLAAPGAGDAGAIKVEPDRASYRDSPNPIVSSAKFLFGLITRQQPDMGKRGGVNL